MIALEQRYCNRKPRCVMARPSESLKNNNAEIWRETHLSRASEGPKRTGSSNPFRSSDESVRTADCVCLVHHFNLRTFTRKFTSAAALRHTSSNKSVRTAGPIRAFLNWV